MEKTLQICDDSRKNDCPYCVDVCDRNNTIEKTLQICADSRKNDCPYCVEVCEDNEHMKLRLYICAYEQRKIKNEKEKIAGDLLLGNV